MTNLSEMKHKIKLLENYDICYARNLYYNNLTSSFMVITDVSDYAIGAVLSQETIGKDLHIAYISRLLNKAEKNYSTIEKELLAIVYSILPTIYLR